MTPLFILKEPNAQFSLLPPKALFAWRVLLLFSLTFMIISVGVAIWLFNLIPSLPAILIPIGYGLIVIMVLSYIFRWFYLKLRYERTQYAIDEHQIMLRQGVWWRNESIVARSRVQYVDVQQSPLARYFNLSTVVIFTAGSMMPAITIKDLSPEQAQHIRDNLIEDKHDDIF